VRVVPGITEGCALAAEAQRRKHLPALLVWGEVGTGSRAPEMGGGRWPGYQSFPAFSLTWGPAGPRYVYYIDETQSLLVSTHLA